MLLATVLVCSEVVSFAAWSVAQGELFSYRETRAAQRAIADDEVTLEQAALRPLFSNSRADPYLGYSRMAFLDQLVKPKLDDVYRVLILGGSVAGNVYFKARHVLIDQLTRHASMADRRVEVLEATLGGYKQPQQLMLLSYLFALGGHFDAVVNLDGFNEIVLPTTDNLPRGVHPWFPRMWDELERARDPLRGVQAGEIAYLRRQRRDWAGAFADSWLAWSVTCQLGWKVRDRWLEMTIESRRAAHVHEQEDRAAEQRALLGQLGFTEDTIALRSTEIWARCSIELHKLCESHGTEYRHYLQPNQYVGDKPMGEQERSVAIDSDHVYAIAAVAGYPFMRQLGPTLQAAGVRFRDLTTIFDDEPGPVYTDTCCHLNELGTAKIARIMASDLVGR